jgi:hypothetical protein
MVNARIVVTPLFQMTFQFPKPFFGGLFVGADAFDSESLAETSRNSISFLDTYTTCENGIMSTDIYNKPTEKHQYLPPQSCHPKHCTKSIPYSIVGMVKETIEVFFRFGPLHVNVVYETKPGKWLVRCRLYD